MIAEKLAKEFEKIRTSLAKSKKLILADIDKIDEKYRRLAQEEKKSLTESLGILNDQLKYYDNMLGGVAETVEEITADEQKTEEEPKIQDTIFPENNEEEQEAPESQEEQKEADAEQHVEPEQDKSDETKEAEVNTDAVVTEDVPQPEKVVDVKNIETIAEEAPSEQAIEDIPEVASADWGDSNGEQKLDENGWPVW